MLYVCLCVCVCVCVSGCVRQVNGLGSCGKDPREIQYQFAGEGVRGALSSAKLETQDVYVTPQRQHWPVFDAGSGSFVAAEAGDPRPSMLDLSCVFLYRY